MTRTTAPARTMTPEQVLANARAALGATRRPAAPAAPARTMTPEQVLAKARAALGATAKPAQPAQPAPSRPTTDEDALHRLRIHLGLIAPTQPRETADEAMAAAIAALGAKPGTLAAKPTAAERKPRAPRKARTAKPVTTAALRFPLAYPCNDAVCFDRDRHTIGSAGCAWLEAPTKYGRVRKDRCGAYSESPDCTLRREHTPGRAKRCRFAYNSGDGFVTWRDADAMSEGDTATDALVERFTPGVVVEYGLNGRGPARRLFLVNVERVDGMVRVEGVALDARWFPVRREAARLSAASDVIVHAENEYVRAAALAYLATPGAR